MKDFVRMLLKMKAETATDMWIEAIHLKLSDRDRQLVMLSNFSEEEIRAIIPVMEAKREKDILFEEFIIETLTRLGYTDLPQPAIN